MPSSRTGSLVQVLAQLSLLLMQQRWRVELQQCGAGTPCSPALPHPPSGTSHPLPLLQQVVRRRCYGASSRSFAASPLCGGIPFGARQGLRSCLFPLKRSGLCNLP